MREELNHIEDALKKLTPSNLDPALLEQIERSADGSWDYLDPLETSTEHELRAIRPQQLDPAFTRDLLAHVADLPMPSKDPNIVPFPSLGHPEKPKQAVRQGRWLAAVAAVATMGAVLALWIPSGSSNDLVQDSAAHQTRVNSPNKARASSDAQARLTPAGFSRGLSEARDSGVILNQNQRPHRVLRFVYRERVTLKDNDQRTLLIEQPRVEYLIVPAKTD
ncbi:MAG: hypothetical protein ACO3RV_02800 [Luteolibacter sp.]